MTVINNIYVGGLKKYYKLCLRKFINEVEQNKGINFTGGGGEEESTAKETPKHEFNLDSNVIRMLKEYEIIHGNLDSDNKTLNKNFTNIIPILISRSMKGGFISPFIRNFKNAIKRTPKSSNDPNSFNLVNHIFFIEKKKEPLNMMNKAIHNQNNLLKIMQ